PPRSGRRRRRPPARRGRRPPATPPATRSPRPLIGSGSPVLPSPPLRPLGEQRLLLLGLLVLLQRVQELHGPLLGHPGLLAEALLLALLGRLGFLLLLSLLLLLLLLLLLVLALAVLLLILRVLLLVLLLRLMLLLLLLLLLECAQRQLQVAPRVQIVRVE